MACGKCCPRVHGSAKRLPRSGPVKLAGSRPHRRGAVPTGLAPVSDAFPALTCWAFLMSPLCGLVRSAPKGRIEVERSAPGPFSTKGRIEIEHSALGPFSTKARLEIEHSAPGTFSTPRDGST